MAKTYDKDLKVFYFLMLSAFYLELMVFFTLLLFSSSKGEIT